jgi:hypothetical protein
VNFLYKFRHTDNAPEQLDSTGYAIIRLLLKYDETDLLFKILNDPVGTEINNSRPLRYVRSQRDHSYRLRADVSFLGSHKCSNFGVLDCNVQACQKI